MKKNNLNISIQEECAVRKDPLASPRLGRIVSFITRKNNTSPSPTPSPTQPKESLKNFVDDIEGTRVEEETTDEQQNTPVQSTVNNSTEISSNVASRKVVVKRKYLPRSLRVDSE
ncbi:glycine dehydrogenase (decarboxylating) subunit 2 [Acrasis kona]|uniref:Glycine dehydrogenase (Decarboxylating) subunit 2 n=1 Tax=Acrasis kona TaxID=1008807 RepID=A0AAW2ZA86_9EUKA